MDLTILRRVVWEEMLFANMRANYFAELLRTHQRRDKWLRVGTLVASSGAVATTLPEISGWAKLLAPILAVFGSFGLLISQYSVLAGDAADLHSGWSGLAGDYERLWIHLDDPQAEAKFHQIYECGESLSKTGAKFPYKAKRLEYWLDQAGNLAAARYA